MSRSVQHRTLTGVPARARSETRRQWRAPRPLAISSRALIAVGPLAIACGSVEIEPITMTEQGGSTADAGGADASNDASDAGSAPVCPPTQPGPFSVCDQKNGARCSYGLNQCLCIENGWQCNACPQTEPGAGTACSARVLQCAYGQTECTCPGGAWECSTCPAEEPATGESCAQRTLLCFYDEVSCGCGFGFTPTSTWGCSSCPEQQPQAGSFCYRRSGSPPCPYGSAQCSCSIGRWQCL